MESGDRSFTVEALYRNGKHLRTHGGRYISKSPLSAAKKAFSQYYRNHKTSSRFSLEVHIRETTQNTSDKIFKYKVSKINEARVVKKGDQMIHYHYTIKAKSI
jgi:hypothetical protein